LSNPRNDPELTLKTLQAPICMRVPPEGLETVHVVSVDTKNEPEKLTCTPTGPDAGSGKAVPGGLGDS
jgi:hypothetical protein